MGKEKIITHEGVIDVGGFKIECYILEDETRVISGREMQRALKMVDHDDDPSQTSGARLTRYLNQKTLKSFIYKDKDEGHYDPIICRKGDAKINGYEAAVLVDVCDAFMQARSEIRLSPRQAVIADQCEILVRSFAKLGIIALIDEETGYAKQKGEYQKLVSMFIAEAMRPWVLTFKEQYYKDIYRLMGWDWSLFTSGVYRNHPQIVGKITNDIVYNKLPGGVLDELHRLNSKNEKGYRDHKHFQFLSENIGYRELRDHLIRISVITSMYGFGEYEKAKAHIDQLMPDYRSGAQLYLDFPVTHEQVKRIAGKGNVIEHKKSDISHPEQTSLDID